MQHATRRRRRASDRALLCRSFVQSFSSAIDAIAWTASHKFSRKFFSIADVNILEAISDPKVFGQHFRDGESWKAWRGFLAALFGLPMDAEAQNIFRACTGRSESREGGASEAWLCIGRRGGKSFIL